MPSIAIIVPCFNEALRLNKQAFLQLVRQGSRHLFFVDDGSTDKTNELLQTFALQSPNHISILTLKRNCGKGEAIRAGITEAFKTSFEYIAFLDADLATPPQEFERLFRLMTSCEHSMLFGSRIKKAGSKIERSSFRHITGRIIATAIDLRFGLGIYDTQCGIKLFRASVLKNVTDQPFLTRWFFDVEIFLRLRQQALPSLKWIEEPLLIWKDPGTSKLDVTSFPLVCRELFILLTQYKPLNGNNR